MFLQDGKARGLSPRTLAFYGEGVRSMLRIVGDKRVQDLTTQDLRVFLARSHEEGLSPGGVVARYRAVRPFLRWLVREGVLEHDPTARMKPPKAPPPDLAVVRPGEVRKMLLAADGGKHPFRDKAILLLLWDTAARIGEIVGLRLEDVRPEGIRVKRKGGAYQVLPISAPTRRAVWAYLRNERPESTSDALFLSGTGRPITADAVRQMLRRLARAAGVPYKSPHAFRRGAAVVMVKNGMNPYALQMLMGHQSPAMTAHYVRLAEKDLREIHGKVSPTLGLLRDG
ncbi:MULTISPECIES: tyrosine-type recombinase/integrase [Thermus]|uniref:tyrosine-type recombinase/integrase n=1 Tax=Thermus brockianus TaxID=56956 RepID=UPI002DD4489A|nr:tyrosine-type recombinase/integrase [Thermus brockianus]